MHRGIALVICLLTTSCYVKRSEVLIPVLYSLAPPSAAAVFAGEGFDGDAVAELGGVHTSDGDTLSGGYALSTRGMIVAPGAIGFATTGRLELGFNNEDFYGIAGVDLGAGYRVGRLLTVAGLFGYTYGGIPQNGHTFAARLLFIGNGGAIGGVHGSVYGGWRLLWDQNQYPEAETSYGPGWNTFGGDIAVRIAPKIGLSVGVNLDRQDDITIVGLRLSLSGHTAYPRKRDPDRDRY